MLMVWVKGWGHARRSIGDVEMVVWEVQVTVVATTIFVHDHA